MKFGKYLESEQVPEWAKMYVDYDSLKHSVKVIAAAIANHNRQVPAERMSLIRRASSYLGYNSMQTSELPISPNGTHPGQPQCPNAQTGSVAGAAPRQGLRSRMNSCVSQCAEGGGCSHFGSIVSATPQIALTMSAANSGKVAATPVELAHQANIKLPPSAQDAFAGGIRARHTTSSSSCVSADRLGGNFSLLPH
ncbi:hypothetical protein BX667DRAFT_256353 [Coemansia mojavensis]|nr:hypothetical protein BX667DRAFT_256353 [Coemansia mojavensis]